MNTCTCTHVSDLYSALVNKTVGLHISAVYNLCLLYNLVFVLCMNKDLLLKQNKPAMVYGIVSYMLIVF